MRTLAVVIAMAIIAFCGFRSGRSMSEYHLVWGWIWLLTMMVAVFFYASIL